MISYQDLNLDKEVYYYYCCASLGDTMLTLALRKELEEKLDSKVIFILKETHKIIAKMYDIGDCIIIDNDIMKDKIEKSLSTNPKAGAIYAAHPCLHPELSDFFAPVKFQISTVKFLPWLYEFFGLEFNNKVRGPLFYPALTDDLKRKIETIAPIDKIALISPEAVSMMPIRDEFWESLIDNIKKQGLVPVSNVVDPQRTVKGSRYIDLTIEEALRIGLYCREVHSLRSGLCDLLYDRGKDLHVYYPTHRGYFLYCMNDMFCRDDIDEQIIIDEL